MKLNSMLSPGKSQHKRPTKSPSKKETYEQLLNTYFSKISQKLPSLSKPNTPSEKQKKETLVGKSVKKSIEEIRFFVKFIML